MTTEELKQNHFKAHWNTSEETAEKHRDISIGFAIAILEDLMANSTDHFAVSNVDFEDKINQLKKNLKQ